MKTKLWPSYSSRMSIRDLRLCVLVCCTFDHLLPKVVSVYSVVPTARADCGKLLACRRRMRSTHLLTVRRRHTESLVLKRMRDSHLRQVNLLLLLHNVSVCRASVDDPARRDAEFRALSGLLNRVHLLV